MQTITIKIENVGSREEPVYEGRDLGNGQTMDGERRAVVFGRGLDDWYPGVDDYVRTVHGVSGRLEFPRGGGSPTKVSFRNASWEVEVEDLQDHRVQPTRWPSLDDLEEMTVEETAEVVVAIIQHGNRQWNTSSGAFLGLLRRFAEAGRLDAICRAVSMHGKQHPQSRRYIEARVPAIVIGHYPPIRKLLSTDFMTWQHANPGVAEDLRAAVRNLDLREVADGVVDRYEADRASVA